jgi:hypothetical protein
MAAASRNSRIICLAAVISSSPPRKRGSRLAPGMSRGSPQRCSPVGFSLSPAGSRLIGLPFRRFYQTSRPRNLQNTAGRPAGLVGLAFASRPRRTSFSCFIRSEIRPRLRSTSGHAFRRAQLRHQIASCPAFDERLGEDICCEIITNMLISFMLLLHSEPATTRRPGSGCAASPPVPATGEPCALLTIWALVCTLGIPQIDARPSS